MELPFEMPEPKKAKKPVCSVLWEAVDECEEGELQLV